MKFQEVEYIDFSNLPMTFVYFLMDQENNVVYVGQTREGLSRVYRHYEDKIFHKIFVIPCKEEELDKMESDFIVKYKPIYNKQTHLELHKLTKVREIIKSRYSYLTLIPITQKQINEWLDKCGISPIKVKRTLCITKNNLIHLEHYIETQILN